MSKLFRAAVFVLPFITVVSIACYSQSLPVGSGQGGAVSQVIPATAAPIYEPTVTPAGSVVADETVKTAPSPTAVVILPSPTEPVALPPATATPLPPDPDWLIYLNQFRRQAHLPPLVADPALSAGSLLHSMYMVLNDDPIARYERQNDILYSPAGNRAALNGDIFAVTQSGATPGWAFNFWMSSPFHAVNILNPQLQSVGYANFYGDSPNVKMAAVLDVKSGAADTPAEVAYPVFFPADGGQTWVIRHSMVAFPDSLTNCPGYAKPTGPPIILQLGGGDVTPRVTGHSFKQGETELESCLFDETSYIHENPNTQAFGRSILDERDAIIIMPRDPLTVGRSYSVRVAVNDQVFDWQFETIPGPEITWAAAPERQPGRVFIWPTENPDLAQNYQYGDLIFLDQGAGVRAGPSVGYKRLTDKMPAGSTLRLTGRNGPWLQIMNDAGDEGWVVVSEIVNGSDFEMADLPFVEVESLADHPGLAYVTNFAWGGQTHDLQNLALMRRIGMSWVKIQQKWRPTSRPEELASRIQLARAAGFKVLLSLPGDPYPTHIDYEAYTAFLGGVAALDTPPDAIEVWNEMNLDFEWPADEIDPAAYVELMLKPAYQAIKRVNPRILVISGALAPTGFDNGTNAWADARYVAGLVQAGAGDYLDCVGMHYNAGATPPDAVTGHPAGGHYGWYFEPSLTTYYNAFGGSRPVCITELGYLSGEGFPELPEQFWWAQGTRVEQQGQWLGEALALAGASRIVKLAIVFNVDVFRWEDGDPQAGYAIVRPDGRCTLCTYLLPGE